MQIQRFEIGMMMNNTYVAWCAAARCGVVIDPVGKCAQVLEFIKENSLHIEAIIYTHAHPDHVSGAAPVQRATGARVAAHQRAAKLMRGPLILLTSGLGLIFKPVRADILLDHGSEIAFGQQKLQVLHTPGHTPGGICLAGPGCVFTGDTLINESVGRTDLPGGSEKQLLHSIHNNLLPLADATTVYPGHGPATTIGHERKRNPFIVNSL